MLGGAGNDDIRGGHAGDRLGGGTGQDRVDGGDGSDTLDEVRLGASGRDRLFGGSGDDIVRTAEGTRDTVNCGTDRDVAVLDRRDRKTGCERHRIER